MIFNLSDCAKRHAFCTREVLPQRRGEISTVFTPCRKFNNRRSVSFSRSVKLSPDVATPNTKGLFSIIFNRYLNAKISNTFITNNIITNKAIRSIGFFRLKLVFNCASRDKRIIQCLMAYGVANKLAEPFLWRYRTFTRCICWIKSKRKKPKHYPYYTSKEK